MLDLRKFIISISASLRPFRPPGTIKNGLGMKTTQGEAFQKQEAEEEETENEDGEGGRGGSGGGAGGETIKMKRRR